MALYNICKVVFFTKENWEKNINEASLYLLYNILNVCKEKKVKERLYVCIGTNKVAGDMLGPLTGSKLEYNLKDTKNASVIGTMTYPVDARNLNLNKDLILGDDKCVIAIDSAFDNMYYDNGTNIVISGTGVYPGAAIEDREKNFICGDISLIYPLHNLGESDLFEILRKYPKEMIEVSSSFITSVILRTEELLENYFNRKETA